MRSTHREMRCSAAVQAAHCEIEPGENVTLQYLSHDGRPAPPPCEPSPPHLRQRQNPCRFAPAGTASIRLVREENGNALPGDRARRSRPGARQPLGRSEGPQSIPLPMRHAAMRAAAVKRRTAAGGRRVRHPIWPVAISLAAA
jgi:hypothetical protein